MTMDNRWLAAVVMVALVGCTSSKWNASVPTGTQIDPAYFAFRTVLKSQGGWRAVCIEANAGQSIAHPQGADIDTEITCPIEVGMPIRTDRGDMSLSRAQSIAADAANNAAYHVLGQSHGVTHATCTQIIEEMNRRLQVHVEDARADRCGSTAVSSNVPVVQWPGPVPQQPEDDPDDPETAQTCETAMPELPECWELPGTYIYKSPAAALHAMKVYHNNHSLKLHRERRTKRGPCPTLGTHYNVRAGAKRAGSIVCCDCCSDDRGGPVPEERCGIVW